MWKNRPVLAAAIVLALAATSATTASAAGPTTAWRDGRFVVDAAGVVSRADLVLERPGTDPAAAMPLGNGRLGAAAWASADGPAVQVNRADTWPGRKSPGQLVLPGLAAITSAPDYRGRLSLYDGKFTQSGGGMTATTYVRTGTDQLVVDVTGADPRVPQTARLRLWEPRTPTAFADATVAGLAETWVDAGEAGATGETFGSLAAVTGVGRQVRTKVVDARTVEVTVTPRADGSFRIVLAAPEWHGGDARTTAHRLLPDLGSPFLAAETSQWWHRFWGRVGLLRLSSADGVADYLENLRTIDLYAAAAESGDEFPGSQAGVGDLFSAQGDFHNWAPSAYWHWNLRMQVAANLGAGAFELNDPYFRLYRENLADIEQWTREHLAGRPGVCVPETMRFNGQGYENETWLPTPGLNCDASVQPTWNGRTLSTGAEVAFWVWQQYRATGDRAFLAANYPLIAEATRFLLDYAKPGADGFLHTVPSNAHETQWDVDNPATDLAAERTLFPILVQAATLLGRDPDLAERARQARIAPFPRTDAATQTQLLTPADDASGQTVLAPSYQPAAEFHNTENIGLEPVWPYGLLGADDAVAQRTFDFRRNVMVNDWSLDPVQAARLGRAADVERTLVGLTEQFQAYPSGFAKFGPAEPYVEQIGVLADALQEALVQDYDGLLRIAPAWPSTWDADGTVFVADSSKVDVQVRGGKPVTVALEAGADHVQRVRNPWPGQAVEVVSGGGRQVFGADEFQFSARAGRSYLMRPVGAAPLPFAPVTGSPATAPKTLGERTLGIR